jgi:hypothetical protein
MKQVEPHDQIALQRLSQQQGGFFFSHGHNRQTRTVKAVRMANKSALAV